MNNVINKVWQVYRKIFALLLFCSFCWHLKAQQPANNIYKKEVLKHIEQRKKLSQVIVDQLYSFGELGFQEYETLNYVSNLLRKHGFTVETGIGGIPTVWMATWGNGKPVISLGSDQDGIPGTSQLPGVVRETPLIDGAPGHGEGHNSGHAVNIIAAIAVKEVMEKYKLSGTIKLWGVPEEQLAAKAYLVRDGYFREADAVLFCHVDNKLAVSWGEAPASGMVSVEYTFKGQSAHGAAAWRGRSALDAVELMNVGWNFRREHLRPEQRSHYVITKGGDQPNVVPSEASVWYYFRELDFENIKKLWSIGDQMAEGAAKMTNTSFTSKVLGAAWPQHFNKVLAETMHTNIEATNMPHWSVEDIAFAKAAQAALNVPEIGLRLNVSELEGPVERNLGGPSDDIGDVSWNVPTVTLRYPSNIQGLPFHHWASALAMATPIAHKGVMAASKVQALTVLDLLVYPDILAGAAKYFVQEQKAGQTYRPILRNEDLPPIWLNKSTMEKFRPQMKPFYYNSKKYNTYLEQLGINYPQLQVK